jgi:hypothetical protein
MPIPSRLRAFVATILAVVVVGAVVFIAVRGPAIAGRLGPRTDAPAEGAEADGRRAQATGQADPEAREPRLAAPARPIRIRNSTLFGWALLDHLSGRMSGSPNSGRVTNTVESMIKPWIAADHLRRLAADSRRPSSDALDEMYKMIVDSNDPATEKYFQVGGGDAVTRRLLTVCGLKQLDIKATLWSQTEMTPQDAARYGRCLADGRAAGPRWTAWVLDAMRKVRGDVEDQVSGSVQGGRWGIIDGLPRELAGQVSIKNGWTSYVDGWHVNCLAVHPEWSLVVMLRMGTLRAAAKACEDVAEVLVVG